MLNVFKSLQIFKTTIRKGVQKEVKTPIICTRNKTFIRGFLIDSLVLKLMYMEYVEEKGLMNRISTYTLSQDHVEIFFSKIRARNGRNDNPNVLQFKGAYRHVLGNLAIKIPERSNCQQLDMQNASNSDSFNQIDWTKHSNVYFISSRRPKLDIFGDPKFQSNLLSQEDDILENLVVLDEIQKNEYLMDGLNNASIAYIARMIEEKIESKDFYCNDCKFIFNQNEKLIDCSFHVVESKIPCLSTFHVCKIVDRYLTLHYMHNPKNTNSRKYDFNVLYYMIFQEINFDKMFEETNWMDHIGHRFHMIKCIVQEYISIKTTQVSKQVTFGEFNKLLRSRLTKYIHFCGQ